MCSQLESILRLPWSALRCSTFKLGIHKMCSSSTLFIYPSLFYRLSVLWVSAVYLPVFTSYIYNYINFMSPLFVDNFHLFGCHLKRKRISVLGENQTIALKFIKLRVYSSMLSNTPHKLFLIFFFFLFAISFKCIISSNILHIQWTIWAAFAPKLSV